MQEDKQFIFDSLDTVKISLQVFIPMIDTMSVRSDNMLRAAQEGFINATDLADYLVRKGLPFRSAYKISGQIVATCIDEGMVLETMPLDVYQGFSDLFEEDLYDSISLKNCVERRISVGGTSVASVENQIEYTRDMLAARRQDKEQE